MLDCISPNACLLRGVTAMALIGDDQVERVNGNVQTLVIFFDVGIAARLREAAFSAK